MRSYLSKEDFFIKMKRKPIQEELYQKALLGTLTDEEITNSGQNLWIQDVLRGLKERRGLSKTQLAEQLADKFIVDLEIPKFPVYEWVGSDFYIKPERGFSLDIVKGQYLLIDKDQLQVKVDFSILNLNLSQINELIRNCQFINNFSDKDFIELVGCRSTKC